MKKLTALILAIVLLAGCAQTYDGPTETVTVLTAREMVQDGESRRTVMAYDLYGNCVTTKYYSDGDLTGVHERTFDEMGRQLSETRTDHSGLFPSRLSRTETTYDDQGRVLTEVYLDSSGREQERTEYSYDGNTVTKTIYPSALVSTSHYDDSGLLLRTVREDTGMETVYTYDENGNRTASHTYLNGTLDARSEWTCDESGRILSYCAYGADGARTDHYTCAYDDDARTMTQTTSDGTRRVERYDADGNLLYAEGYDASGNLTMTQTSVYEDIQIAIREVAP